MPSHPTTPKRVAGIEIADADPRVVNASLRAMGQEPVGGFALRVIRLRERIIHGRTQAEIVTCIVCGGPNGADANACAFCGLIYGTEEPAVEAALGEPRALVDVTAPPSRAELDVAMMRVRRCAAQAAGSMWDLGQALLAIWDPGLWRARYNTWEEFCLLGLEMKVCNAQRLMAVSRAFDRETVAELGPARLAMALRVPEGRREELLAKAREGLGAAGLAAEVSRLGLGRRAPPREHAPRNQIALIAGVHKVRLKECVSRATKRHGSGSAKGKLAIDGAELRFRLVRQRNGEQVLFVNAHVERVHSKKRGDDAGRGDADGPDRADATGAMGRRAGACAEGAAAGLHAEHHHREPAGGCDLHRGWGHAGSEACAEP